MASWKYRNVFIDTHYETYKAEWRDSPQACEANIGPDWAAQPRDLDPQFSHIECKLVQATLKTRVFLVRLADGSLILSRSEISNGVNLGSADIELTEGVFAKD